MDNDVPSPMNLKELSSRISDEVRSKSVEEGNRYSEDHLRKLWLAIEVSPSIVMITDKNCNIEYTNPKFVNLTGYSSEEVLGKNPRFLKSGKTSPDEYKKLWDTILSRSAWEGEFCNRKKNGELYWERASISPVKNSAGVTINFVKVAEDITELKKVNEELNVHAIQQRAITELGQLVLEENDMDLLIQAVCSRIVKTLGVEFSAMFKLLPDGRRLMLAEGLGWKKGCVGSLIVDCECFQGGGIFLGGGVIFTEDFRNEKRFKVPSALLDHHVVSGMSVIIRTRGKPFGVLGAYTTENRIFGKDDSNFLEAIANMLAGALERKKTEEILSEKEEQFRQAQKMEAVGRLAGGIAHDFNNLLTAILGYSDLVLLNFSKDHPQRKDIEEIKIAAERAALLTNQLLVFSRKQVLELRVIDLNTVVTDMNKMLHRLIGEDIDLAIIQEPNLWHIRADSAQLGQVIVNLLVNARDAMPNGGKLVIKTENIHIDEAYCRQQHRELFPGNYVTLIVEDSGCGMDKETQSHIFEPFFTTKEKGKGTGLGLSTVYGIVKQSGGYISVYSEAGKGTSFKMYFPRFYQDVQETPKSAVVSSGAPAGSETIFLVEDENLLRKLIREILERNGYTVLMAADAIEAIRVAERYEGHIHLLLSDLVIPKMNGKELKEHILKLHPEIKTLFISGYTDVAATYQGLMDSSEAFVQKPFTADALNKKIREVLDAPSKKHEMKSAA